jgi:hypothetical protein
MHVEICLLLLESASSFNHDRLNNSIKTNKNFTDQENGREEDGCEEELLDCPQQLPHPLPHL